MTDLCMHFGFIMIFRLFRIALVPFIISAPDPVMATTVVNPSLFSLGNYSEKGGTKIGTAIAVSVAADINAADIDNRLTDANKKTVANPSLFTLGNYSEKGGTKIGTGIAISGDADINSVAIGTRLTDTSNKTGVVLVGGNIRYENSTLEHGSVIYGSANKSDIYVQAQTPNGSFTRGSSLDFAAIGEGLLRLSAQYEAADTTGSFSSLYGAGTLTGSSKAATDIFTLSAHDLGSISSLQLLGAAGSKAIINIRGDSFGSYFSFDRGNYAVSDITFNFVDAQKLSFDGIDLAGSLLAPLATMVQKGGAIQGIVAVKNFEGAGARIDGDGGFAVDYGIGPIPEPGTWSMLIIGFGFVALAMRRQRRVVSA